MSYLQQMTDRAIVALLQQQYGLSAKAIPQKLIDELRHMIFLEYGALHLHD